MAECYITGKKTTTGNNRSHAMNASKRVWKPNLQRVRIIDPVTGEKKKVYVSARALKKGNIKRA